MMPGPNVDHVVRRALVGMIASLLIGFFFLGFAFGHCAGRRACDVQLLPERAP